jgi:hypothetical protein
VLAIAYAGMYPEQVLGVLNFVGGWMGEGCSNAGEINDALFPASAIEWVSSDLHECAGREIVGSALGCEINEAASLGVTACLSD